MEFRVRWTVGAGAQTVGAGLCTESSPINAIISIGLKLWGFRVWGLGCVGIQEVAIDLGLRDAVL